MAVRRLLLVPAASLIAMAFLVLASPSAVRSLDATFSDPAGDSVFIYLDGEPPAPACPGDITSVQVQSDAEIIRFIVNRPSEVAAPWSDEVKVWLGANSFLLFKAEDGSTVKTFTWNGGSGAGLEVTQNTAGTVTTFEIPASYAAGISYFYVYSFHQDEESDPDARCGDETGSFDVDLTVPATATPTATAEPTSQPTLEPTVAPTSEPTMDPTTAVPPTGTVAPTSVPPATATLAATQAPAAPATGTGGAAGPGADRLGSLALAGAMLAAGSATMVFALRRRGE